MDLKEYIEMGVEARRYVNPDDINDMAREIFKSIDAGHKLVAFGNGGSAADAQHFVAELMGRFLVERPSMPAIALTTNTSILTAIGNDYSYSDVFSRQVKGIVNEGDFVVGISTSGNSENVIKGIQAANDIGAYTLALTGRSGGKLKNFAKRTIAVQSDLTPIIQEIQTSIIHMICMQLDELLLSNAPEGVV